MPARVSGILLPLPSTTPCASGTAESTEVEGLPLLQDYYQKVYPRAFKKGIELARKCTGLRHIVAISGPGKVCHTLSGRACSCANARRQEQVALTQHGTVGLTSPEHLHGPEWLDALQAATAISQQCQGEHPTHSTVL